MGGSMTEDEILDIKSKGSLYRDIQYFVETGTYKAATTIVASSHFEKVFTIEICEPLYRSAKQMCQDDLAIPNIQFILGDTLAKLPEVMEEVSGSGCVYFIDAHISGSDSGWNENTRVPLFEELDIILQYRIPPSVFIFDDVRLWKTIKAWDWVHITDELILSKFKS